MIAIVFDEDQHSRRVLGSLLATLGYEPILIGHHLGEASYLLQQHRGKIKLIIASRASQDEPDQPLLQLASSDPSLAHTPLVLTLDSWIPIALNRYRTRHSRIDDCLRKPFGLRQLRESLRQAHRSRAECRSTLLVLNPALAGPAAEAVYASGELTHWKQVSAASNADEIVAAIAENGLGIGGVLLDPSACTPQVIAWIARFRKTSEGAATPVVALSRKAEAIHDLRQHCDLFLDPPSPTDLPGWETLVTRVSHRVRLAWEMKQLATRARQALKEGQAQVAGRLVRQGLAADPDRWELREIAAASARKQGDTAEAVTQFRAALEVNPCLPFAYLSLFELLDGDERREAIVTAARFCSAHPEIRKSVAQELLHADN